MLWRSMLRLCVFAALLAGLLSAPSVRADIIIDDFETGPFTLTGGSADGTVYSSQTGMATSHIVGGSRHTDLYSYGDVSQAVVSGGRLSMACHRLGVYHNIQWNGASQPGATPLLNLDLTSYGHFELTFDQLDKPVYYRLRLRSGNAFPNVYRQAQLGVNTISLAEFGSVNWADIDMIRLEFYSGYMYDVTYTHTESISDFRIIAIPEPSTLLLCGLGLLATATRRSPSATLPRC